MKRQEEQAFRGTVDFLIIGAQKSGTTTLYDHLSQHPSAYLPEMKDLPYCVNGRFCGEGELARYYRTFSGKSLAGGSNVHLMYFPGTAEALHGHNPEMKLIALLRNPVDRAYSSYWYARRNGWEPCSTFEEAIRDEAARHALSEAERAELTHVSHGYYHEQLERYLRVFSPGQLCVVLTDDLKDAPRRTLDTVFGFLGLPASAAEIDVGTRSNVSSLPRSLWLQRFFLSKNAWHKELIRRAVPASIRYRLQPVFHRTVLAANLKPFEYPPMAEETRLMLKEHYAPWNRKLAGLLGRDLGTWE